MTRANTTRTDVSPIISNIESRCRVIRARTTDVDLAPSLFKGREMRGTSGPAMMDNERAD